MFANVQAVGRYIHATVKKISTGITSVMGPTEEMALDGHPVTGLYSMVAVSLHFPPINI